MQDFQYSNKFIINKSDLSHQHIIKYLDDIKNKSVDYADIYFQYSKNEFWSLEDSAVKNGSFSIDQGVGMRSIAGEKTAFTYSDEISLDILESGTKIVKSINAKNQNSSYNNQNKKNLKKISNEDHEDIL